MADACHHKLSKSFGGPTTRSVFRRLVGLADRAADAIRPGREPAHREGIGHRHATGDSGPRRRGDRVSCSPCPLWVISRSHSMSALCPLYPWERTPYRAKGMSARCQQETLALQKRSLRLKALLIRAAPLSVLRLVFRAFNQN